MLSEEMKGQLDREVQQILKECAGDVEKMLQRESTLFERFAESLLEKEELNYSEIEEIFKNEILKTEIRLSDIVYITRT